MSAAAESSRKPNPGTREDALTAYLDGGWKEVPGWLYDGALHITRMIDLVQKRVGIQGHIGEIGLFQGKLFILHFLDGENNFVGLIINFNPYKVLLIIE